MRDAYFDNLHLKNEKGTKKLTNNFKIYLELKSRGERPRNRKLISTRETLCITHQADTLIYKHHLRLLPRSKTKYLHRCHLFLIIMSTNNHEMVIPNIGTIMTGFQIITDHNFNQDYQNLNTMNHKD